MWRTRAALCVAAAVLCVGSAAHAAAPTPVLEGRAGEFQPARGSRFLAWERNTRARPDHYDVFARAAQRKPFRVNARGSEGAVGGIDGVRLIYQQWRGRDSDLAIYNLRRRRRNPPPRGVNTRAWEYWPSMSGRWILFGRRAPSGARRVVVFDRRTHRSSTVAWTSSRESFVAPGQVRGRWAVWSKCTPTTACNVWRMDLRTGARAEVPNPGAFQRAPSVTRAGTVFFVRSGRNCGESVRLMRYAPGAPPKELVRLPAGEDIDDTYAYSRARSPTKVFYERNSCTRAYVSDVWAVRHARLFTLGVRARGAGGGTVTSVPAGVTCGSDCAEPFRAGTTVTLEARPQSTSNFTGWGGACSGHARKCTVAMSRARSVTAFFDTASSFSLSVTKKGRGRGRVRSDPPGIACGRDCWEAYSAGTRVTLRAAAARGSEFHEWRGACSGRRRCTLTVDRVRSVTAVFVRARRRTSGPVPDHMLAPGASPARAS